MAFYPASIPPLSWKLGVTSETVVTEEPEILIAEITTVLFCTGNATFYQLKHSGTLQRIE